MSIYKQAMDFTLLVERFIRADLPDGVRPATASEVAAAMYMLRAHIPEVTKRTGEIDYARAWNAEAMNHDAARRQLAEMAEHLRWALRRISTSLDCGTFYDRAEDCLAKYDEQRDCELPTGCRSPATCDDQGMCCGALAGTDIPAPAPVQA
jgi:hypothetical protein